MYESFSVRKVSEVLCGHKAYGAIIIEIQPKKKSEERWDILSIIFTHSNRFNHMTPIDAIMHQTTLAPELPSFSNYVKAKPFLSWLVINLGDTGLKIGLLVIYLKRSNDHRFKGFLWPNMITLMMSFHFSLCLEGLIWQKSLNRTQIFVFYRYTSSKITLFVINQNL